jgi:hypothetical protein
MVLQHGRDVTSPVIPLGPYLLIDAGELAALPTSGTAYTNMLAYADAVWPTQDIQDPVNQHAAHVLAGALVYARTGTGSYRTKTQTGIMAVIGTEGSASGPANGVLAMARHLSNYALAADLIGLGALSPTDDDSFRTWAGAMRAQNIGSHARWKNLRYTHEDAGSSWGSLSGASRIAVSAYLGDTNDLAAADLVYQGFLGDRTKWIHTDALTNYPDRVSWSCAGDATAAPINPACTLSGINANGFIPVEIAQTTSGDQVLTWPPADEGIDYQTEALHGLMVQAQLLYRQGYSSAWLYSDQALKRAADVITRSGDAAGRTWNEGNTVKRSIPWLLNSIYGTTYPTVQPIGLGLNISHTDWLYGG